MPLTPIQQEWVDALRSGEYKQGRSELRTATDSFCCLGVLCDLAVKHGVIPDPVRTTDDTQLAWNYGTTEGLFPNAVAEWAGMPDTESRYGVGLYQALYQDNDNGVPFAEIADIIEANADTLFVQERA